MKKIELKPLREWVEKSKECAFRPGSLRLYFGERDQDDESGELFFIQVRQHLENWIIKRIERNLRIAELEYF